MLYPPRSLGSVLVLGLGRSGVAVARYCLALMEDCKGQELIDSLTIYGGEKTSELEASAQEFLAAGIPVHFDIQQVEGHYDLGVISPGIPPASPFCQSALAACDQLVSEPAFAFRLSPERWIGITGTNGKTTTTELTAHLLACDSKPVRVAGNIGQACTQVVQERQEDEYLVVELSSFQLEFSAGMRLLGCVLLNITPDHLSWHGSMEAYTASKMRVFDAVVPGGPAIIDARADNTYSIFQNLRQRDLQVIPLGGPQGLGDNLAESAGTDSAAFVDQGLLTLVSAGRTIPLIDAQEMLIAGEHNQENALAAASLAYALGCSPEAICRGLKSFHPLEHRIEPCGQGRGLSFFNDSKATNPEAVLPALTAFDGKPIIILLGGKDKGTDLTGLVQSCLSSCREVICYGASKERFLEAFRSAEGMGACAKVAEAQHMADALELAVADGRPGDVVLLSPACASFDEFNSFEERGQVFKDLVSAYLEAWK